VLWLDLTHDNKDPPTFSGGAPGSHNVHLSDPLTVSLEFEDTGFFFVYMTATNAEGTSADSAIMVWPYPSIVRPNTAFVARCSFADTLRRPFDLPPFGAPWSVDPVWGSDARGSFLLNGEDVYAGFQTDFSLPCVSAWVKAGVHEDSGPGVYLDGVRMDMAGDLIRLVNVATDVELCHLRVANLATDWHQYALALDGATGEIAAYFDGLEVLRAPISYGATSEVGVYARDSTDLLRDFAVYYRQEADNGVHWHRFVPTGCPSMDTSIPNSSVPMPYRPLALQQLCGHRTSKVSYTGTTPGKYGDGFYGFVTQMVRHGRSLYYVETPHGSAFGVINGGFDFPLRQANVSRPFTISLEYDDGPIEERL